MALSLGTSAQQFLSLQHSHRSGGACFKCGELLGIGRVSVVQVHLKKKSFMVLTIADVSSERVLLPATGAGKLALKPIPGDYGPPLAGLLVDRLKYFWLQGRDNFFSSAMERYGSTVIRVNMPPGPPFFPDSRTIMLLDQKSYRVLFDMSKVEKKDVFVGTYMPSTEFTGGFRVLPYLDPSEKNHAPLKSFCSEILRYKAMRWIPEFHKAFVEAARRWEGQLAKNGKADFSGICGHFTQNFLFRSVLNRDPATPGEFSLGNEGPSCIQAWVFLQLHPQTSLGLPLPFEEFFFHSFPLPYALIASQHEKLYKFFWTYGKEVLDLAVDKFDLDREEACHNLLFFICFNTWGGIQLLFPSIIIRIAAAGPTLQQELAREVREAVEAHGGLNMKAISNMELLHSTVYEVLRIDPPVPFQYARAKKDFIVESHDAAFKVQRGELLGGYLGMAMKDPKVFQEPKSFNPKRFMGEEGRMLLHNLIWSNGPETHEPTTNDKQCAGKDFVNFVARLLVAEFFLRYDSFEIGPVVKRPRAFVEFTSLRKRGN
eukprot:c21965_g1_i1 orf=525-2150(-)